MSTDKLAWPVDVLGSEGLNVVELNGWHDRGHGGLQQIWRVICHHTGSNNLTAKSIAEGRADLAAPPSHLRLAQDGTVTLLAEGIAYHAGNGSHDRLPDNDANLHTVGIQTVNNGTEPNPEPQYRADVQCCIEIMKKIERPALHVIGHTEWNADKADPALDLGKFLADIEALLHATSTAPATGR